MLGYAFSWLTATKDMVMQNPVTSGVVLVALVLVIVGTVVYFKKK